MKLIQGLCLQREQGVLSTTVFNSTAKGSIVWGCRHMLCSQTAWAHISTVLHINCVALGKLPPFLVPQFSNYKMKVKITPTT